MTRCIPVGLMVALVMVWATGGCATQSVQPAGPSGEAGPAAGVREDVNLCAECGQIKGSEACCDAAAPRCAKCKLIKGSPGCCKLPKDAVGDVLLCGKCGFIKGTAECCKTAGKTACAKCGLIKGSPGCCKIPKAQP